jgi:glycerol uptake facilitator-like aquaporin
LRFRPEQTPVLVGLYITSAYWFTASTSFANPAVTIARALTDSFAGISPRSAPLFVAAQVAGAIASYIFIGWLFRSEEVHVARRRADNVGFRAAGE